MIAMNDFRIMAIFGSGLPLLTHATATTITDIHMRLKTMNDLNVGDHVVLSCELLEADRTWIVLDVRLVRGDVVPTKVADVCVGTMTYGAPINVALFNAKVSHRALRPLVFDLKRTLEVALTDLRLAGDQIKYGTAQIVFRHFLLRLRVGMLGILPRRCRRRRRSRFAL